MPLDSPSISPPRLVYVRAMRSAQRILGASDGKDYIVDVQNCILAFAGRVLLKKACALHRCAHSSKCMSMQHVLSYLCKCMSGSHVGEYIS